MDVGEVHTGFC